ncbi:MAG: peptidoglycan synthetase [Bacteroidia bacterium]|nr:peptidoglycan synthetase [Bacteroidia bacterium]
MHNLALALHEKGFRITGSDDEIFEPSLSRLKSRGLLPSSIGWDPSRISEEIDAVILGMHARADNPELLRAKALGLKIFSYPEYLYEQSRDKKRVVIGGSHGKTTITSMILHVLRTLHKDFDYMVGAQVEGFQTMVRLSREAPVIILEGDEYLSSPIDRRPKFHLYRPHLAILSGIAWDHINVFPTFGEYVEQFRMFIRTIMPGGTVYYCAKDEELNRLCAESFPGIKLTPYGIPDHQVVNGVTVLRSGKNVYPLQVFGEHNLMNLEAAKRVCLELGIEEDAFLHAMSGFKGAAKRLEPVAITERAVFYKDFAHSPSKLKATVTAMKAQWPDRPLLACMELHTFSSLNEAFLSEYKNSMDEADTAVVYFNPHTIEHKKLSPVTPEQVRSAFGRNDLEVYTESRALLKRLRSCGKFGAGGTTNLLMMTSGNFDGVDFAALGRELFSAV